MRQPARFRGPIRCVSIRRERGAELAKERCRYTRLGRIRRQVLAAQRAGTYQWRTNDPRVVERDGIRRRHMNVGRSSKRDRICHSPGYRLPYLL